MSSDSFLKQLLAGFADALEPLKEAIASPQAFASYLGGFGWTLGSNDLNSVTGSLGGLSSLAADPSSMSLEQLAADLVSAANVIRRIASSGAPAAFASTFPKELLDFLVYYALAQQSAPAFALLHFGGVLSERRVPADSANGRAEYVQRLVNWGLLGQFANQPLSAFEKTYGWGADFAADAFLRSLGILIRGFGGNAGLYPADASLIEQYYSRDSTSAAGTANLIVRPRCRPRSRPAPPRPIPSWRCSSCRSRRPRPPMPLRTGWRSCRSSPGRAPILSPSPTASR